MSEDRGQQEVSLGDDFDAVVRHGGTTVELKADGNVIVHTNGAVEVRPASNDDRARPVSPLQPGIPLRSGQSREAGQPFKQHAPPREAGRTLIEARLDARACGGAQVGDGMPDRTVFAGISPDTKKAMYAMPLDAPLTYTFRYAQEYAQELRAHGHQDWRVPTKGELNVLFQNRAEIGGFDIPAACYWSSSQNDGGAAWNQRFSDGHQDIDSTLRGLALRCVR